MTSSEIVEDEAYGSKAELITGREDRLHRTVNKVITNAIKEMQIWFKLMDQVASTVELELLRLEVKVIGQFSIRCRRNVSDVKPYEGKGVLK